MGGKDLVKTPLWGLDTSQLLLMCPLEPELISSTMGGGNSFLILEKILTLFETRFQPLGREVDHSHPARWVWKPGSLGP